MAHRILKAKNTPVAGVGGTFSPKGLLSAGIGCVMGSSRQRFIFIMSMTPDETKAMADTILAMQAQLHDLRCADAAFGRMFREMAPIVSKQASDIIWKFEKYKKECSDAIMLEHQKKFPPQGAVNEAPRP